MFDELTKQDIENMQKEIDYRKTVVRADLHEKIMAAKEFGDFSENSELYETKRAKGRNESRISYLENMIRTARIVEHTKNTDKVGLGSVVTVELDGGKVMTYQITTTISQDAQNGKISVKSPFAKATVFPQTKMSAAISMAIHFLFRIVIYLLFFSTWGANRLAILMGPLL